MASSIAREVELCTRLRWLGRPIAWVAPDVFMPRCGAYRKTPARKLAAEAAVLGRRDCLRFEAAVFGSPGTQPAFWITSAAHFCCVAPNAPVLAWPPCAPRDCGTTEAPRVARTTGARRVGRAMRTRHVGGSSHRRAPAPPALFLFRTRYGARGRCRALDDVLPCIPKAVMGTSRSVTAAQAMRGRCEPAVVPGRTSPRSHGPNGALRRRWQASAA